MKRLLCAVLLLTSLISYAGENAYTPARRSIDYFWMSIGKWNELHDNILKRGKEGPVDLLFLGDSITEQWASNGKAVWDKNYAPLKAGNFGIGGDMTQQVLWRITEGKELDGISPKVCVLMIGTNNFGIGGQKPDEVVKGIEVVLATIRQKLPNTKILLLAIFPRDEKPGTPNRNNIATVNAQIAKFDNGKNIRYLDIGPKLASADGSLNKEIMPDFLHLTQKGYEIWVDAMQPLLSELLK